MSKIQTAHSNSDRTMAAPLPPGPDEVHLFYTRADSDPVADLMAKYRGFLSDEELAKADRYRQASDQRLSLVSRALIRFLLSEMTGQSPESIRFSVNAHGKPGLSPEFKGSISDDLCFNLSHSHGMVACAISRCCEVGVDVEDIHRKVNFSIARRFFSSFEAGGVETAEGEEKKKRFFDIWTLKEAYIKAVGKGLAIPLDSFSFHFQPSDIQISFKKSCQTQSGWQFFQWRPNPSKIVSVAACSSTPLVFKRFSCVPFAGVQAIG